MSKITIRVVDAIEYIGIPFCPPSFFDTSTINFSVNWGDGSTSTITSDDDPVVEKSTISGALTLKHSYVNSGDYTIVIEGGYGDPGVEKLAFAQCSKQNAAGVSEYYYGRGALSTPEKIWKIFALEDFYIHGQGDFKDFSNLTLLHNNITPLLSSNPASTIQINASGTYLMNQTFENVGALNSYLSQSSSGKIVNENCTSLQKTFKNSSFNGSIGGWNVSSVVDASGMLEGTQAFQGNIAGWTWTALKNASSMFKNSTFTGWINPWFSGTAKVLEDTSNMFEGVSFTGNSIATLGWNMSTIKSTKEMFKNSDFTGGGYMNNWFKNTNVLEDASGMFEGATDFNQYIGNWDIGATNLSNMFKNTTLFNKGIGLWDVSSVVDASGMFEGSQAFQQNIAGLTWTALKNASSMFKNSTYTKNINLWFSGTAKVLEDTSNMFEGVSFFESNGTTPKGINTLAWNMSTVKSTKEMFKNSDFTGGGYMNNWFKNANVLENMSGMFEGTTKFNQYISNWDVSKVKDMSNLFKNSTLYNQNLNGWDVSLVEDISSLFEGNAVFDKGLHPWIAKLNNLKYKDNYSNGNFSLTFQAYELNASVATNGLQLTMSTSLSSNLDFWTYEINNGDEKIANHDQVTLELDPGTYNVKYHGYINNLSGEALKQILMSTFSLSEAEVLTSGTLPTSLSSRL
jgi:hypothetical protein